MAKVMAVEFERYGQLHYLDPGDREYAVGDWVRYPTPDGVEVARVVWATSEAEGPAAAVCPGPATAADLERDRTTRQLRVDGAAVARELVAKHRLPMKIVGVDYLDSSPDFDRMFAIYYTAPGRVDFRTLLGDLARRLHARIDLRQVGSRDAARLIGGIGSCGREICCSSFLTQFEPVSMRLLKGRGVQGNPLQLAGACGRLKCCLMFEAPACGRETGCSERGRVTRPGKGANE